MTASDDLVRERFLRHQHAWDTNPAIRALYTEWYTDIRDALGPAVDGQLLEIGSGPGFARQFLPTIRTSDLVAADWLDQQLDATHVWPFADASLDGVVVFDVLHHLADPAVLFSQACRTLKDGGRLVLMEPHVSALSYPVYRFLHEEDVDLSVNPFMIESRLDKDPFEANQAIPTLVFGRYSAEFSRRFPELHVVLDKLYSGFSYVASSGLNRKCPVPFRMWQALHRLDRAVPEALVPLVAFRRLIALELNRSRN